MKQLAEKIQQFEKDVSKEKGDFLLCALVLRDRSHAQWDLVLSASWFGTKRGNTLKYIIGKLKKQLSDKELLRISKIVLLDPVDPFVAGIVHAIHAEHGLSE